MQFLWGLGYISNLTEGSNMQNAMICVCVCVCVCVWTVEPHRAKCQTASLFSSVEPNDKLHLFFAPHLRCPLPNTTWTQEDVTLCPSYQPAKAGQ